jgi:putative N6-adenine-specific DNA methylase
MPRFFATAAKGTEGALRDELREQRFRGVRADRGGVHFEGSLSEGLRACIELRIAVRVLLELASFDAHDEGSLYEGVRSIDWGEHLDPSRTLAVRATVRSSALTHSHFVALKTKDAIVDRIRDEEGARPSIDRDDPDLLVSMHLAKDVATVYLDVSGGPLHLRGYRLDAGEAPLKETLAAALVRLSGWDRERPFVDPMCGSGTIAIEAAMWSRDLAPGLGVKRFGIERWASFDEGALPVARALREQASARARAEGPPIIARDVDVDALERARVNARRAGVELVVERASISSIDAPSPIQVVTNPPYGERLALGPDAERVLGRSLARLEGSRVGVLAGSPKILEAIRMRPVRPPLVVYNGDIECRFAVYEPGRPR